MSEFKNLELLIRDIVEGYINGIYDDDDVIVLDKEGYPYVEKVEKAITKDCDTIEISNLVIRGNEPNDEAIDILVDEILG